MAKTSVEAEWKAARSVRRQGERSEMKHLLLCAVLKVTEWKKCSEPIRRNACNEVTGGSGTLFCLKNWEFFNYRKYTMLINKTNGDLNRHIFSYF